MICGLYENVEQTQLIEVLDRDGKRKRSKVTFKEGSLLMPNKRRKSEGVCVHQENGTGLNA